MHTLQSGADLNGWDLWKAGKVLGVGDGGDQLDGADDRAGGSAVSVGSCHAGTGGTGGVGVMQRCHREGTSMPRVGMLRVKERVERKYEERHLFL